MKIFFYSSNILIILITVLIGISFQSLIVTKGQELKPEPWVGAGSYPDIRGAYEEMRACGPHVPLAKQETSFMPYICDPNQVLNRSAVVKINERLHSFSIGTQCPCQRKSQCTSEDQNGRSYEFGFVGAVAVLYDINMDVQNPSASDLDNAGQRFASTLRRRWSLGDCGNTVVLLLWQRYQKLFASCGRVSTKYLTEREIDAILSSARQQAGSHPVQAILRILVWRTTLYHSRQPSDFGLAPMVLHLIISYIEDNFQNELLGEPDKRIDVGTLSLVLTVFVALFFVLIITGCVCAFRCCGNMSSGDKTTTTDVAIAGMQPFRMDFLGGQGATPYQADTPAHLTVPGLRDHNQDVDSDYGYQIQPQQDNSNPTVTHNRRLVHQSSTHSHSPGSPVQHVLYTNDSRPPFQHAQLALYDETTIV